MKKLISILLTVVLVLSLGVCAYATENDPLYTNSRGLIPKPVPQDEPSNPSTPTNPSNPSTPTTPSTPSTSGSPYITVTDPNGTKVVNQTTTKDDVASLIKTWSDKGHGYKIEIDLAGTTVKISSPIEISYGELSLSIKNGTIDGQEKTCLFYVWDADTDIYLENMVLQNGKAAGDDGGAFYIDDEHINIWGSGKNGVTISNCESKYGGAIYYTTYGWGCTVSNVTFKNNKATEDGGALFIDGEDVSVTNCKFINNSCRDGGGSIYVYNDNAVISACTFTGGKSDTGYGREVYVNNYTTITQSTFQKKDDVKCSSSSYLKEVSNTYTQGSGSLISGGALWIVVAVVVVALAVVAVVLNKKRKGATK